jgi:hydrophobe/amphiphile efflux-3 (HAE3) family protein
MKSWIRLMITQRKLVLIVTGLVTLGLLLQLKSLSIIIDPDDILPQTHPYIVTNNEVEKTFGNKSTVVVGISAKEGDVYQPAILAKVKRITDRILNINGVVKSNVNSLSARKAKNIQGTADGMVVTPLMGKVPQSPDQLVALQAGVASNPVYEDLLVSKDKRTTQIVAEFKKIPGGFKAIDQAVREAIEPERDDSVEISVGGLPTFLALLEQYSGRMAFLFPLALLLIGLIHYEAFRTLQALILPLVTALIAVIWATGVLALTGQSMDVFNSSTPILILAIAAGHAVQILKRYYEEYAKIKKLQPELSASRQNEEAVLSSLTKVGPVMVVACIVAALGFFSLIIFEIKSIRTFGIFTGSGVVAALILELTLIPALRSMLRAPSDQEYQREQAESFWDRLTNFFYILVTQHRSAVYVTSAILIGVLSLGGYWLRIDNSQKGYFFGNIPAMVDDDKLNTRMAGTNTIYVLVDSGKEDGIKDPAVMLGMERIQEFFAKEANVGKSVSLVNFIKRMNQSLNADDPAYAKLPDSSDLVAQYLLLYSNSGEPGDFDSYVDYGYRKASIQAFLKTDSSAYVDGLASRVLAYAKTVMPASAQVSIGGGSTSGVALNEVMIREKVLNILQIMLAVFIVSALVFRSFTAGLLILVPLVAAVFVNFGVMGLLGIPLQIATALVSAMAVGIGADYGIYMSYRMREELRENPDEAEAIAKSFKSAGKAALFVSSAVAGGFGVLMLSWGFFIHIWMGFLIATAMLVSSVAALTIFPALILTLRPRFIFAERKRAMSKEILATAMTLALAWFLTPPTQVQAQAPALSAEEIAKKSFLSSKVTDSIADSTFRLINANGQERVRETKGQTKLIAGTADNMRVVTFLSPSDVKGTKTLMIEHSGKDDEIWIYLPAMKKVRRLVANNKKDSFVGTDFSYGDVIGHKVEDWNHKTVGESEVDGRKCWLLESTPKRPEVAENSGYSKRTGCVDKESFIALQGELFDTSGTLIKKISAKNVEKVDAKAGKWQAMRLEAENVQTGHRTILEFKNYKANAGVSDDVFTTRYLEKQ